MNKPILVDSHEDLAWNILSFGRDYSLAAADTRQKEQGTLVPQVNGDTLLGWPDYQRGKVAVVFSTLFAAPIETKVGEWDLQCYADPEEAHMLYSTQLDAYARLLEKHPDLFRRIEKKDDLKTLLEHWQGDDAGEHPVGLVTLMEGAEGVREPAELEEWFQRGVRIIGPAWKGTRFSGGTGEPGPLTKDGFALLEAMSEFHFTLDLSHMDEKAALQALDVYPGPLIASHSNALALLKGSTSNRHLTDRVIQGLLERGGIIGSVPYNNFLKVDWKDRGGRSGVTLDHYVAQIDYICQMAGDASHVGIGTDFDGGLGVQSAPVEIDTIADMHKIIPILLQKGYTEADISAIIGGNWLVFLERTLPEAL
jgi:membrane dipeptidase